MTWTSVDTTAAFMLAAFDRLGRRELPSGGLDAARIPGTEDTFVAISGDGERCIVLPVNDGGDPFSRNVGSLRLAASDEFSLHEEGRETVLNRAFALISLRPGHDQLLQAFV